MGFSTHVCATSLTIYINYVIAICETLSKEHDGLSLHTLGVCQPSVPLLAAVALMETHARFNDLDGRSTFGS
jgi:poly-beta-hydroxyalkanoate depolymerase